MKNIQPLYLILGGCGLAVIGCCLPWATFTFEASTGKITRHPLGIETGRGVLALLLAAAAIVLYFVKVPGREKLMALVAMTCAVLAALVGISRMVDIDKWGIAGVPEITVSIGIGVYLTVLGGLVGAFGWFQRFRKISAPISPPSGPSAGTPPPAP